MHLCAGVLIASSGPNGCVCVNFSQKVPSLSDIHYLCMSVFVCTRLMVGLILMHFHINMFFRILMGVLLEQLE